MFIAIITIFVIFLYLFLWLVGCVVLKERGEDRIRSYMIENNYELLEIDADPSSLHVKRWKRYHVRYRDQEGETYEVDMMFHRSQGLSILN